MTRSAYEPTVTPGEPIRELAEVLPEQGDWSETAYLAIAARRGIEFDNGMLEILPVPTKTHQLIIAFLFKALEAFLAGRGRVFMAGYRLKVGPKRYREPDLLYLTPEQDARAGEDYCEAADVVMEVVSADDPDRDYVTKRRNYAEAGIPEYWIVDPIRRQVLVLRLDNGQYIEHGRFGPGHRAASHRLGGFEIAVDDVLTQGR